VEIFKVAIYLIMKKCQEPLGVPYSNCYVHYNSYLEDDELQTDPTEVCIKYPYYLK
jgi:hypothetical protein